MADDDFLHNFREQPDEKFAHQLYQQLSQKEVEMDAVFIPKEQIVPRQSRRVPHGLTLAAAMLAMVLLSGILVLSHTPQPTPLTQTATPDMAQLQVISIDNAAQLQPVKTIGNGTISDVVWSPDGEMLAVAGVAGIWLYSNSASPGAKPDLIPVADDWLRVVTYSPDGKWLAAAGDKGDIHLWDAATLAEQQPIHTNRTLTQSIVFSTDSQLIISAGGDWEVISEPIQIWDVATGTLEQTLTGPGGRIQRLVLSADGKALASLGYTNSRVIQSEITLWDMQTGQESALEMPTNITTTSGIVFTPDSKQLVSVINSRVYTWDTQTGAAVENGLNLDPAVINQSAPIENMTFSPDGKMLVLGVDQPYIGAYDENSLLVLDTERGWVRVRLSLRSTYSLPLWYFVPAFSPDGTQLAATDGMSALYIWDLRTLTLRDTYQDFQSPLTNLTLSADGQKLVTTNASMQIAQINLGDGRITSTNDAGLDWITGVSLNHTGNLLGVGGYYTDTRGSTLQLWDTETNTVSKEFVLYGRQGIGTSNIVFSADDTRVATMTLRPQIWDVTTGEEAVELEQNPGDVYGGDQKHLMAMSADGGLLAATLNGQSVRVWDATTGKILYEWGGITAIIQMVFTPDGDALIISKENGVLQRLQLNPFELQTIQQNLKPLWRLAFSPDGTLLAGVTQDGVQILDAADYTPITTLESNTLTDFKFSSDGRFIVTSGYDGVVRVWGVPE